MGRELGSVEQVEPDQALVSDLLGPGPASPASTGIDSGGGSTPGPAPAGEPSLPPPPQPIPVDADTFVRLLEAFTDYLAARRGEHWAATGAELQLMGVCLAETSGELLGKLAALAGIGAKLGVLTAAVALYLVPRIVEDTRRVRKQHKRPTRAQRAGQDNVDVRAESASTEASGNRPTAPILSLGCESGPSGGLEPKQKGQGKVSSPRRRSLKSASRDGSRKRLRTRKHAADHR